MIAPTTFVPSVLVTVPVTSAGYGNGLTKYQKVFAPRGWNASAGGGAKVTRWLKPGNGGEALVRRAPTTLAASTIMVSVWPWIVASWARKPWAEAPVGG